MALEIRTLSMSMGNSIICLVCPHRIDENSEYEWVDSNMDTHFVGSSLEELAKFLITHALAETTKAFYMQSPVIATCRCGHGFSDHSFYGETRTECHGKDTEPETMPCDCTFFQQPPF